MREDTCRRGGTHFSAPGSSVGAWALGRTDLPSLGMAAPVRRAPGEWMEIWSPLGGVAGVQWLEDGSFLFHRDVHVLYRETCTYRFRPTGDGCDQSYLTAPTCTTLACWASGIKKTVSPVCALKAETMHKAGAQERCLKNVKRK